MKQKRMLGRLAPAAMLAAAVGAAPAMANAPLELEYTVEDIGGGVYEYEFWLTLTDPEGIWEPGMGWGWFIFGDDPQESAIEDFEVDPDSWPVGPWTELDLSLGPNNHGPTFAPVTDTWTPDQVGDQITWKGTSTGFLGQGELFFSSEWPGGGAPLFNFELATKIEPCIADWNGDGEVDVNDFFAYLDDFEDGDPRADLNNDGEIDINDFFIFLDEFEQGC